MDSSRGVCAGAVGVGSGGGGDEPAVMSNLGRFSWGERIWSDLGWDEGYERREGLGSVGKHWGGIGVVYGRFEAKRLVRAAVRGLFGVAREVGI